MCFEINVARKMPEGNELEIQFRGAKVSRGNLLNSRDTRSLFENDCRDLPN